MNRKYGYPWAQSYTNKQYYYLLTANATHTSEICSSLMHFNQYCDIIESTHTPLPNNGGNNNE